MTKHNKYNLHITFGSCLNIIKYSHSAIVSKVRSPDKSYYDMIYIHTSRTYISYYDFIYKLRCLTSDVNIHLYLENDHYKDMYHIKYVLMPNNNKMYKIIHYMHETSID
jgi:hypothetical protein